MGSILGLSGIVLGYSWQQFGPGAALPAAVLTGLLCGALNGFLITRWTLPPLVVTLATMSLFRGGAMVISQAKPVSDFPEWFSAFGQVPFAQVPKQLLVWFGLVAAFAVAAERTPLGRYAAAIGDRERAATFAALPVNRVKFMLYTVTGLLSALGAVIFTSRVSTAKADAGMGLEMEAITAVVLGGTAITGGRGTVVGTFIGVVILGFLRNGLTLAGIGSVWQQMIAGGILIATAILNQWLIERASRRPSAGGKTAVAAA